MYGLQTLLTGSLLAGASCAFGQDAFSDVDSAETGFTDSAAVTDDVLLDDPMADDVLSDDAFANLDGLDDLEGFLDADLEELATADVVVPVFTEEVTTVTRGQSTVGKSPAAVYVVTSDMIRRSGSRSIPEALRLVPGVQVARIDANKWAISIRGLNQRFSNKLLVQIDGRTVYTPLFAGVFWDVQDVLMEDIARIEVIRGPGATVWGANAVNGVINVITKSSRDTVGTFVEGGGGNRRGFASARVGRQQEDLSWRVSGKWFERDAGLLNGTEAGDDWRMGRLGFRSDWQATCDDLITLQGDYYTGEAGQSQFLATPVAPFISVGTDDQQLRGGNVLTRWTHTIDDVSNWSLQVYYDRTDRSLDSTGFREERDTFDVDFQHQFELIDDHRITWGAGFRNTSDRIRNSFQYRFDPTNRSIRTTSLFVQDEITLVEDEWKLITGSKFSWNDLTGFEIQPTARLLFTPSDRQSIWASVSRAVRVPSRATDDVRLVGAPGTFPVFPTYPTLIGSRGIDSEELLAWEFGMRGAPVDEFFWDFAAFFNQYDSLQRTTPGFPGVDPVTGLFSIPLRLPNTGEADTYGFELASTLTMSPDLTFRGGYSFLRIDYAGETADGESPRNQLFLHTSADLTDQVSADLVFRYTDSLPALGIEPIFEMDARLAYQPADGLELALTGRNLLDSAHREFENDTIAGVFSTEIRREVFGTVTWRY